MRSRPILAAVAVLACAVLLTGCAGDDTDSSADGPSAAPSASAPAEEDDQEPSASVTFGVPASPDARCVAPSAEFLTGVADQAFEGVAESVVADTVTLTPTRWYAGEEVAEVNVVAPSADMQAVLLGVDFVEGERYLVAVSGETLVLCGHTGPVTKRLTALYDEAFGG